MDKYRPSNGTEGMIFQEKFCDQCFHDINQDCPIIAASMLYERTDPEYPEEWTYDRDGKPTCIKFLRHSLEYTSRPKNRKGFKL